MFKLSFNKPAARLFPDGLKALDMKVGPGKIILHPSISDDIDRQEEITRNLRGGFYVCSEDKTVESYLKRTQGKFYGLQPTSVGTLETYYIGETHSKYEPCIRVTLDRETEPGDIYEGDTINFDLGVIRNAYIEMSKPKGRGRPTLEMIEARKIKHMFETQAASYFPKKADKLIAFFAV
jgi:hypothetical protein